MTVEERVRQWINDCDEIRCSEECSVFLAAEHAYLAGWTARGKADEEAAINAVEMDESFVAAIRRVGGEGA